MAIIRNFRLPVGVGVSADYIETFGVIQSTTPTTGAIVSRGGVGVGNSISIAGHLQLFNDANYTAFQSSATGNTLYTLPATSPATGSSVLQSTSAGVMSWVPMIPNYSVSAGTATTATYSHQSGYGITAGLATTATNINVVLASTSASHQLLFTPTSGSASGVAVSSNSTLVYNPSTDILSVSGLAITATTNSTSFTTGALIVSGGVGVGGSSHFNSPIHITSTINSTDYTTGALIVDGGIGVSKDIYLGGTVVAGSWAGNAITGRFGGTGYTTYTKGDLLVGVGSTLVKVGIGSSHQVLSYSPSATSGLGWTDLSISFPVSLNYGAFYSNATQPVLGANTITPITVNNTYEATNIEIYGGAGTSSRIRILNGGVYNIQFSVQMNLSQGTQPSVADFWFRINGTDVALSNSKQTIQGKDNQHILAMNFVSTFTAGQYFELMMSSPDQYFILENTGSTTGPIRPATPSVIYTVTKVL